MLAAHLTLEEIPMIRALLAGFLSVTLFLVAGCATAENAEAPQVPAATVYEGAQLIVGDGSDPIQDSAFVVQDNKFTVVGRKGQITVPEGAARVDLTGKT